MGWRILLYVAAGALRLYGVINALREEIRKKGGRRAVRNILIVAILGALIGFLYALLLAPEPSEVEENPGQLRQSQQSIGQRLDGPAISVVSGLADGPPSV